MTTDKSENLWLNQPTSIAISHEGAKGDDKRITIDGFRRAHEQFGFRFMETDLRLMSDGRVAALHKAIGKVEPDDELEAGPTAIEMLTDPNLKGVGWNFELKGDDGTVAAALARDLKPEDWDRILISFGTTLSSAKVQSIRDVLPPNAAFAAAIRERAVDWDVFPSALIATDVTDPRLRVAQVMHEPFPGAGRFFVDEHDVQQAHARGLALHTYDIFGFSTDRQDVAYLLDVGVDGIITDDHQVVFEEFQSRGFC